MSQFAAVSQFPLSSDFHLIVTGISPLPFISSRQTLAWVMSHGKRRFHISSRAADSATMIHAAA
jgi:hypothetical protein